MIKNTEPTIGEKIKQFRKHREISQLDLELAISASPGTISRIEHGKTNPTKETLISIATALKLRPVETSYLLGYVSTDPSDVEIENAKTSVQSIIDSISSYSYLLDNKSRVIEVSQGFKNFLIALGVDAEKLLGVNIVEILFNPDYKVRESIEKDKFINVARCTVAVLYQERAHLFKEKWWQELFKRLHKLPDFTETAEYISKNRINVLADEYRTVSFKIKRIKLEMIFTPIYLYNDPRFTLVQYLPKSRGTSFLLKLQSKLPFSTPQAPYA